MANDVVRRVRTEKEIIYKSGFPMVNPKIRHAALPSPPSLRLLAGPRATSQRGATRRHAMWRSPPLSPLCKYYYSTHSRHLLSVSTRTGRASREVERLLANLLTVR